MRSAASRSLISIVFLVFVLALSGCGASLADRPAVTPTATPTATPQPGTFYFTTSDGVTLNGRIFGQGKTALIFSNGKGFSMQLWVTVAQTMADRGYMSMLYDYRGVGQSQGTDNPSERENDLRAAISAARAHGASKVVLIGSSFGGLLAAKLAVEAHAEAIVLVSAALEDSGIVLRDKDIQALAMPKLLMASESDTTFAYAIQHIYDTSPQPKQIALYPGKQHGTTIFGLEHSADSMQRLSTFLDQYAPA